MSPVISRAQNVEKHVIIQVYRLPESSHTYLSCYIIVQTFSAPVLKIFQGPVLKKSLYDLIGDRE